MTVSGVKIDSYTVTVIHNKFDIEQLYMGNGGVNIWPILNNEFRLKVFNLLIKKT